MIAKMRSEVVPAPRRLFPSYRDSSSALISGLTKRYISMSNRYHVHVCRGIRAVLSSPPTSLECPDLVKKITPLKWEVSLIRLEFLFIHEHVREHAYVWNSTKHYVVFHSFNIRQICYHEKQSQLAMAFCGFHDVVLTRIIHENLMCDPWF